MVLESVPSPCIGLCELDLAMEQCRGCLRTRDEIAAWSTATNEERQQIWHRLLLRQRHSGGAECLLADAEAGKNDPE